jgi:hypothetical protein
MPPLINSKTEKTKEAKKITLQLNQLFSAVAPGRQKGDTPTLNLSGKQKLTRFQSTSQSNSPGPKPCKPTKGLSKQKSCVIFQKKQFLPVRITNSGPKIEKMKNQHPILDFPIMKFGQD